MPIWEIVAGIGRNYPPESLLERKIVIAANLEPKLIKGVLSQGMLLTAGDKPVLLIPEKEIEPGSKIS